MLEKFLKDVVSSDSSSTGTFNLSILLYRPKNTFIYFSLVFVFFYIVVPFSDFF